eukprot:XP_019928602.1 PREDICTED: uncharacterized protein LOC105342502 [Crassostrea gigas]
MKNIVTFVIAYMTLFECSQTMLTKTCVGRNGTSCCVGLKWDLTQEKCIPCDKGYMGPNCESECPFPSYGEGCQMICNCIEKVCDPANGCYNSSTEYPMTSLMGLEDKILKTELLNYEASISENFSKVTPNNDTTTWMAVKQESKRTSYMKFALIGLTVVSIIIVCIYFYIRLLEKRFMITRIV